MEQATAVRTSIVPPVLRTNACMQRQQCTENPQHCDQQFRRQSALFERSSNVYRKPLIIVPTTPRIQRAAEGFYEARSTLLSGFNQRSDNRQSGARIAHCRQEG